MASGDQSTNQCQVPMWCMGLPAGRCGKTAHGTQYPREWLWQTRLWTPDRIPYCHGPCCENHGGPGESEVRIYQDGLTPQGRPMWCAAMPDFTNLQESPAGFSGDARVAVRNLNAAIAKDAADGKR